ncbi:MAG: CinA family nicotinamide mononucleotide deamidase-related protein [Psychroflexus sp.]|nr:CinA family nicotinamide mononucleotide deamidase-related protein [Psychroflexus sp.]MDR9447836.1 CinA family nicotinamide mononucleotide deamidase-related protein [Psychroflexus sp.]
MAKATLITIGDEILIGQIVDSNSAYIAKKLNNIGVEIHAIYSVQDDYHEIKKALKRAENETDIIITTGGLGPTKDDITKATFADYFNDKLIRDDAVLKHIEYLFEHFIQQPILQVNRDQALVPSKAEVLFNHYGTAPGMWINSKKLAFIALPGVPFEMKALLEKAIPKIQQKFKLPYIVHKTVLTYGLGESAIADKIDHWVNNLPDTIKLAYLPNLGRVRLRLSTKGFDKQSLIDEIDDQIDQLKPMIGDIMKGIEGESTPEEQIADILTDNKKTLAVAESCTGGQLASRFTKNPGASAYFTAGIISYATSVKSEFLSVDQSDIDKYSVVSGQVAEAMAKGAQEKFNVDYALSTTGNAGPDKGDSDADVGTVFIGLATPNNVESFQFSMGNHRERVVQKTINKAIEILLDRLLDKNI